MKPWTISDDQTPHENDILMHDCPESDHFVVTCTDLYGITVSSISNGLHLSYCQRVTRIIPLESVPNVVLEAGQNWLQVSTSVSEIANNNINKHQIRTVDYYEILSPCNYFVPVCLFEGLDCVKDDD